MKKVLSIILLCTVLMFSGCQVMNSDVDLGPFSEDVSEFAEKYNSGRYTTSLQEGVEIISCQYVIDESVNQCNLKFSVKNMTGEAKDVSFRLFSSSDLRKYTDAYDPLDSDFGLEPATLQHEDIRTMNIILEFKTPYSSMSEADKQAFIDAVSTMYAELQVGEDMSYLALAVSESDTLHS